MTSRPIENSAVGHDTGQDLSRHAYHPNYEHSSKSENDQVISVRITSSVAIGRGKGKSTQIASDNNNSPIFVSTTETYEDENEQKHTTNVPVNLEGANIEFIKQLNAKKETKEFNEPHPYQLTMVQKQNDTDYVKEQIYETTKTSEEYRNGGNVPYSDNISSPSQDSDYSLKVNKFGSSILDDALKLSNERLVSNTTDDLLSNAESKKVSEVRTIVPDTEQTIYDSDDYNNRTDDSIAESSLKSVLEIAEKNNEYYENIENVPLARSVLQSPSSKNYIQGLANKPPSERESSTRLTTVSFNVVHDTPNVHTNTYNSQTNTYVNSRPNFEPQLKFYEPPKVYSQPGQIYSEPAKFYSEPAKIYSEPAKIYSEPARIYSEPAKIYSEPAKIYSEPAKIYSEPEKFYSEPASLHLEQNGPQSYKPWQLHSQAPSSTSTFNTTPITTITLSGLRNTPRIPEHQAEKNYEVDEKDSVLTHGRSHGIQESTTEKCKQDNCKVGYVVKGRQYNKYRVEERTSDGFIVGEYGVVRNEDGALRGVRYTADSDASPRLIYDALMKFLQLK